MDIRLESLVARPLDAFRNGSLTLGPRRSFLSIRIFVLEADA